MFGKGSSASLFLVGTHVHNLNSVEIEFQTIGDACQPVGIAKQDGETNAFRFCLHGRFHCRGVSSFSKDNPLGVHSCRIVEFAGEFRFLPKQLPQTLFVVLPVCDFMPSHPAFDGGFGYSGTYFGDESRIYGFGNEVFWPESELIDTVNLIYNVRNRLFGQIGNRPDSCHFHLFVDGRSVYIQCPTEDVRESDDIVDLVGVVASAG